MLKPRWLLCLLLGACYDPDLGPGRFDCGGSAPVCPEGQRCIDGKCRVDPADLPPGCQQPGGFVVGSVRGRDIYACPGTFPRGEAPRQCVGGYRVCASAEGVDLARCGTDGFFLTSLNGRWDNDRRTYVCASSGFQDPIGCGSLPRGVRRAECGGFTASLDCDTDETFTCGNSLDQASNSLSRNGVLCCPP